MAHSFDFPEYGATVHVNSDFSGDATIHIDATRVKVTLEHNAYEDGKAGYVIELPAGLLKEVSRTATIREIMNVLEAEL